MAINSYTTLKAAVNAWVPHDDLGNYINDMLFMAEVELSRRLTVREMLTSATGSLSGATLALPSDFIQVQSFYVSVGGGNIALEYLSPTKFFGSIGSTQSGPPRYYTIVGTNFHLMPQPDSGYTYYLQYYSQIPHLSAPSPTNWLIVAHPDVYLFACLAQAAPYLHDDERVVAWRQELNNRIDQINGLDQRSKYAPGAFMRPDARGI